MKWGWSAQTSASIEAHCRDKNETETEIRQLKRKSQQKTIFKK